jgi:uncharacterized membrane protein YbhN (UPF0104 family)
MPPVADPRAVLVPADLESSIDAFLRAADRFFHNLADVGLGWLAAALVLSLALQLCRGHAWANALRAAYPRSNVSELGIQGAFLVGAGMNGILPARGGDALKIVLGKRSIEGSNYPSIISSFAVLGPFDFVIGIVVLIYAIAQGLLPQPPRLPRLEAFEISFWAEHPGVLVFVLTALAIGAIVVFALSARRAEAVWKRLKQGVAIFREPRRYLREVAAWQAAGWLCRFASFWLFLEAFHIGGAAETVLLVMSVQAISGALPLTPGGAGAQQALLVATLEGPSRAAVLSYSVGQQVAVTAWSIVIAFGCLFFVFRVTDWKRLVKEGRTELDGDSKRSEA